MQPSFNPVFNSLVYSPYSKRGYFPGSGSLTDTQLLAAIDPDQMLLIDSTPHYTTAQWSGYEHLLRDAKPTVGTLRTPRAGRCWLFDGSNDYGTRGARLTSGTVTGFTFTAWIKQTVSTGAQTLASEWLSTGNQRTFIIWVNAGQISFYNSSDGIAFPLTNTGVTVTAGTWIHIGVTYNAGTLKVYKDGVEAYSGTVTSSSLFNSTAPFYVGSYDSTGWFNGSMRDIRVYSNVKSAAEILAIKNQADTPGTYDTTGLLAGYWCEEESGTTGYDWSGNGRHLTLTNITQASFHASDTGVTYSDANVRGYRLSGSVYIPATSSTLAADGNALTHTGKCPQPGYGPQKVATFDGTNDYATLGARLMSGSVTTFTVSAWVKPVSAGAFSCIACEWNFNQRSWIVTINNGNSITVFTSDNGTNADSKSLGTALSAGVWTHVTVTYNSGALRLYYNGIFNATSTAAFSTLFNTNSVFASGAYEVGATNGFPFNGSMADLRVYSSVKSDAEILAIKRGTQDTTNLLGQWPMCEGPGSGNTNTTIYDVSGNGKHLTITNATVSSFWANASTYDSCIPNHPLKYGYTIDGSGVVVPAKLDGLLDAAGNAIGTAAGKWKSGLQNINCLPYTNPLGVNIGLETALDPTADRKTTSSSKRRRRNTSGLYDRIGARATAMSDASSNAYFGD